MVLLVVLPRYLCALQVCLIGRISASFIFLVLQAIPIQHCPDFERQCLAEVGVPVHRVFGCVTKSKVAQLMVDG